MGQQLRQGRLRRRGAPPVQLQGRFPGLASWRRRARPTVSDPLPMCGKEALTVNFCGTVLQFGVGTLGEGVGR